MSIKRTPLHNGLFVSTIEPINKHLPKRLHLPLGSMYETMVLDENFSEIADYTNYHAKRKSALQYHRRLANRLTAGMEVK